MFETRQRCSADVLKCRIKKIVRTLVEHEKEESHSYPFPAAELVFKSKKNVWIRGMWSLVILTCILMTLYQTYDRIKHYLSYPVVVDVYFRDAKLRNFPEVTFCIGETHEVVQFFEDHYKKHKQKFLEYCNDIVICYIDYAKGFNVSEAWKRLNTSTVLQSAELQQYKSIRPKVYETYSLFGLCTTVKLAQAVPANDVLTVTFRNALPYWMRKLFGRIQTGLFINEVGAQPTSTRYIWKRTSKTHHFKLVSKYYSFVKRPGFICVDQKTFDGCLQKCFHDEIFSTNVTCRWPYYPNDKFTSNLPDCILGANVTLDDYKRIYYYAIPFIPKECPCPRKCKERSFEETATYELSPEENSIFTFGFGDTGETVIIERLSYDVILLLCDIGGNCGLFTGLSLLSIIELTMLACTRQRHSKLQFKMQDPIFRKVIQLYQIARCHQLSTTKSYLPQQVVLMWTKRILTGIAILFCAYAVAHKMHLYFSYPVTVVVEITYHQLMLLPNIAFCWRHKEINNWKKTYSRMVKVNHCNVSYINLVGFRGLSANHLWRRAKPPGKPPILSGGDCYYKQPGVRYIRNYYWIKIDNVEPFCSDDNKPMFYYPSDESLDIYKYEDIPNSVLPIIVLNVKEVRLDKLPEPCESSETVLHCKEDCFRRKLLSRLNCSLPYMPGSHLPPCYTSASARKAQATFLDVDASVRYPHECNCPPKCVTTIYELRLSMEPYILPNSGKSGVRISSVNSVIESYNKVLIYPGEKLISDIGGYVGFILGWCVISMLKDLFGIVQQTCIKC